MLSTLESVIKINNEIDMYEEYFEGEIPEYNLENVNVKTLKIFKNMNDLPKRAVSSISWHPDGPHKIAASYSML